MGQALLHGILKSKFLKPTEILDCDVEAEPLASLIAKTGVAFTTSTMEVAENAEAILVAVKPKDVPALFMDMPPGLLADKLVLSVAAGITLGQLANYVPTGARVVRVMPNTPALVGQGASAYACEKDVTAADVEFVEKVFGSVGIVRRVEENLLDAVTGLSGSGPAYVFTIIEALADGGVQCGLPRALALELAAATVAGAAAMVVQGSDHPAVLRDAVASPGGTTIAGIAALEAGGLRGALINAVNAAARRSAEMSRPANGRRVERPEEAWAAFGKSE